MLTSLNIKNFRCFKEYEVDFDKFNIIVGKNNTGKSTLIDALKVIANTLRYAPYRDSRGAKGRYLEERDTPFTLTNLSHDYSEEDSIIYSRFSDNTEVEITFPFGGRPYADLVKDNLPITSRNLQKVCSANSIGIIPPVSTFEEYEDLGNEHYLRSILVSHLTPKHFRNIWLHFDDDFEEFRNIVEETWPHYTIERPEFHKMENQVCMFFKEDNMPREIYWAGHGFQIWLQLMTHIVKLGHKETIILDEPDIYLHSDMQRKLINICKKRTNEVIIATHAVDIIEEGDPDDIISIDKNSTSAKRLSSISEVQTCINQLGSPFNLKLVHFFRGKSCLFVEGEDFKYLKIFAQSLNKETFAREDGFSVVPLEGFSNWDRLIDIDWIFRNALGETVKCYVILDRDYYTGAEIHEIVNNLHQKGVKTHVWNKKEIENYAINEDALFRMFGSEFRKKHSTTRSPISKKEFNDRLLRIFEELKQQAQSQVIGQAILSKKNKGEHPTTIISRTTEEFEKSWKSVDFRKDTISGKDFFAKLNSWLKKEYNVTLTFRYVIRNLKPEEIDNEIKVVIVEFMHMVGS